MSDTPPQNPWGTILDFLADRDRYYPIFASLASYLGIAEVVALTRTCKKLSGLYQELLPIDWNIDRDLRRFLKTPCQFRAQMRRHNALLYGDFAHQFFARETLKLKEMDVAIQYGNGDDLHAFIRYLLQTEGYEEDLPRAKYDKIYILRRKNVHGGYVSQIHIRGTQDSPLSWILLGNGPASVAFISWNKAYAITPQLAFVASTNPSWGRHWRIDKSMNEVDPWWNESYELYKPYEHHMMLQCGGYVEEYFEEDQNEWHDFHYCGDIKVLDNNRFNFCAKRHVGDRHTWTISFDTSKVARPKPLDFEPEGIHFAIHHVCYRFYQLHADETINSIRHQDILTDCIIYYYYPPGTQTRIVEVSELSEDYQSFYEIEE